MSLRIAILLLTMSIGTAIAQPLRLYAAGSLRTALTEVANQFEKSGGGKVEATFGPSGLLRERIEKGEAAEVFASADMEHPRLLAASGRAAAPVPFARNRLCALAAPGVDVTSENLLDRMLDPKVKLGTSTPKADPSGDYAWQLFEKAEKLRPGAFVALDAKALKLTGGRDSPTPPPDRSIYGVLMAERKADIFLTYCTNAMQAVREVAGSNAVAVPAALAVGAEYGVTTMTGAPASATALVKFLISPEGSRILARHGFAAATE
jgi:ABC-type molybdate transport system substrate-binding protein